MIISREAPFNRLRRLIYSEQPAKHRAIQKVDANWLSGWSLPVANRPQETATKEHPRFCWEATWQPSFHSEIVGLES